MARLTDAAVRSAKAEGGARDIADGTVPGLYLRVSPTGRKGWTLRLRVQGRNVRLDLGEYPGTGLADARELAQEARRLAGRGENPAHAIRPPPVDTGLTVEQAVARWLQTKAANRSLHMETRRMALHVLPHIGEKPLRDVTRGDLHSLLHDMAFGATPKPVEANRVFVSMRGFFGWAQAADLRDDDPSALLQKPVKVEPSALRQKEGTEALLSMDELARLWRVVPTLNSAVLGDLVRCMILVPLRRDEWTDLQWSEVRGTFTADGWTGAALAIPAARMKGKRPATVPLPQVALDIVDSRRAASGRGPSVFSVAGREAPFTGWKRAAETMRKALGSPQDWSPHTIRKSVATALVRDLGADELLVGRILQHSPKAALGITAVYQRSSRLAEQAALLQRWADHIRAVAAAQEAESNVVPLRVVGGAS